MKPTAMPPKRDAQLQPPEQSEAANPTMDQMIASITSLTASVKALKTSNDQMQAIWLRWRRDLGPLSPIRRVLPRIQISQHLVSQPLDQLSQPPRRQRSQTRDGDPIRLGSLTVRGMCGPSSIESWGFEISKATVTFKPTWPPHWKASHSTGTTTSYPITLRISLSMRPAASKLDVSLWLRGLYQVPRNRWVGEKDATAYIQDLVRICRDLGWIQSDGGGSEAVAVWTSTTGNYSCTHKGCTHHHRVLSHTNEVIATDEQ